jgi:hypothetical protein
MRWQQIARANFSRRRFIDLIVLFIFLALLAVVLKVNYDFDLALAVYQGIVHMLKPGPRPARA